MTGKYQKEKYKLELGLVQAHMEPYTKDFGMVDNYFHT